MEKLKGKGVFLFCLTFSLFVINSYLVLAGNYSTLDEYYNSIDYSCSVDEDCAVKDIGNCCGYFPKCVNSNAEVNVSFVDSVCLKENLSSVCGFSEIDYCACENGACVGKQEAKEEVDAGSSSGFGMNVWVYSIVLFIVAAVLIFIGYKVAKWILLVLALAAIALAFYLIFF